MIDAERFCRLADAAADGLKERGEIVAGALLAVLSGQSVFFYGPPGTAKSLIARRLSGCFKSSVFFECLMNRFTTPEEIFGPVSIRELKTEDRYVRKTDGFLPSADFGFLDEIWKSSPAILNTLLTILNERKFRNGDKVEDVPLKAIVAASNEIPQPGQGLEALYDRFIMRFAVPPVRTRRAFESLLGSGSVGTSVDIAEEDKISNEEWAALVADIAGVGVSKEALNVIHAVRVKIQKRNAEKPESQIYVSDRRWMKAVGVAKTAAAICGRKAVMPVDTLIIPDCIWSKDDERDEVQKMVDEAVREFGTPSAERLDAWEKAFSDFESASVNRAFWDRDVFNTVMAGNVECVRMTSSTASGHRDEFYIPVSRIGAGGRFHPLSKDGLERMDLECSCHGGNDFGIRTDPSRTPRSFSALGMMSALSASAKWNLENNIENNSHPLMSRFTLSPIAHAGDCKDVPTDALGEDRKTAGLFLSDIVAIASDFDADASSEAENYPFVPKKRLAAIGDAYRSCRQRAANDKVKCEYLIHRLGTHKAWT
ncbi:MAG: AAA family ATPase [Kiritimatiellae bacterium]|nr:AAA family ATPase [Kiritimatiellia bacterium]